MPDDCIVHGRQNAVEAALVMAELFDTKPKCWWVLAFMGENGDDLGGCIVRGYALTDMGDPELDDFDAAVCVASAVREAHAQLCNAGGSVIGLPAPTQDIDERYTNKLLDGEMIVEAVNGG